MSARNSPERMIALLDVLSEERLEWMAGVDAIGRRVARATGKISERMTRDRADREALVAATA